MDISGSYTLQTPREQVWNALRDPDTLKRAIPGCEALERTGDNAYAMRLNVGVAGVKGIYTGSLHVLDEQAPETYRVVADGTGTRGIIHGDGVLRLEAQDAGATVVHYSGQAQLGGTIASMGAQVASGAAYMLIKQYFTRLADLLPSAPIVTAPAIATTPETPMASEAPAISAAATKAPDMPVADAPPTDVAPVEEPAMPAAAPIAAPTPAADSAPAAVDAFMPPPTAPIIHPHPPTPTALETPAAAMPPPTAPIVHPHPPATLETPAAATPSAATPSGTPATTGARRSGMADGAIESQRKTARFIFAVIAIVAAVVVVVVVLAVAGAFR